jgi:hypothetical protein
VSRKVGEAAACPVIILPRGSASSSDDLVSQVQEVRPS